MATSAGSVDIKEYVLYVEDGIGHFAVGNDGGAALLCCPPGCVHFGCHAPAPSLALVPELDIGMQLWGVGVDDPAGQALLGSEISPSRFFLQPNTVILT